MTDRFEIVNAASWENTRGQGLRVILDGKDLSCRSRFAGSSSGGGFWTDAECTLADVLTLSGRDIPPFLDLFVTLPSEYLAVPVTCVRCSCYDKTIQIDLLVRAASVGEPQVDLLFNEIDKLVSPGSSRSSWLGSAVDFDSVRPISQPGGRHLSVSFDESGETALDVAIRVAGHRLADAWQQVTVSMMSSLSLLLASSSYNVALSFAGEDREYAELLATALRAKGLTVFYDRFEQSTMWGLNLYEYLADVYGRRADYCVIVVSLHYAGKQWPTHERQHAQARALRENREYILPIRLDSTEVPGLPSTINYIDARQTSVETIAAMLCQKLEYLSIRRANTGSSGQRLRR